MDKKLIEIASEIVHAQVSSTPMKAVDISSSLREVFNALHELHRAESGEIELPGTVESTPAEQEGPKALKPSESIRENKIICLECGAEMKQLTVKHLASHAMSQKEYRVKYGFTMRTPLTARALTKARSKAAKKRGLPEKLQEYIAAKRQAKDKATAPPRPAGPEGERIKKVRRRFSPNKM